MSGRLPLRDLEEHVDGGVGEVAELRQQRGEQREEEVRDLRVRRARGLAQRAQRTLCRAADALRYHLQNEHITSLSF